MKFFKIILLFSLYPLFVSAAGTGKQLSTNKPINNLNLTGSVSIALPGCTLDVNGFNICPKQTVKKPTAKTPVKPKTTSPTKAAPTTTTASNGQTCDEIKSRLNWAYGNKSASVQNNQSPCQCIADDRYTDYEGSKTCPALTALKCGDGAVQAEGDDALLGQECKCADGTFVNYGVACSTKAAVSTTSTDGLACLSELRQKVAACSSLASKANLSCDKDSTEYKNADEANSGLKTGQEVLSVLTQYKVQQSAKTQDVSSCLITPMLTQTSWGVLESMKEGCSSDIGSCQESCEDLDQYFTAEGLRKLNDVCNPHDYLNDEESVEDVRNRQIAYNNELDSLKSQYDNGVNTCNQYAKNKKSSLEDTLASAQTAAQQAAKVCCQTQAGGGVNCNTIPAISQCSTNPNLPGCTVYNNNCVANPSSQLCVCAANPTGDECRKFSQSNSDVNKMVGALGVMPTAVPTSVANKAGGGVGGGDFNFGDDEATKVVSGTADAGGSSSPFSTAQGGGGGFGGGGGAGGLQNEPGQGSPEDDGSGGSKGSGGLFNAARSFINDLIGGKKPSPSSQTQGPGFGKNKVDPNAWKPKGIRGLANDDYAIGSKNKDIFQVMQKRYLDQTHTFFGPNEPLK